VWREKIHRQRTAWAILAAALVLGAAAPAGGQEKQIPARILPRKDIPNEARVQQAPALDERQRKNRKLVNQARQEQRELKPGGTAFPPQ